MTNSVLSGQVEAPGAQPSTLPPGEGLLAHLMQPSFCGGIWSWAVAGEREKAASHIVFESAGLETLSVWLAGWWEGSSVSCGLQSGF